MDSFVFSQRVQQLGHIRGQLYGLSEAFKAWLYPTVEFSHLPFIAVAVLLVELSLLVLTLCHPSVEFGQSALQLVLLLLKSALFCLLQLHFLLQLLLQFLQPTIILGFRSG